MSAWNASGGDPAPTNWQALSGDHTPAPQPLPAPAVPAQPIHGGWTQPWQDETGQWHYPYAGHAPAFQPGMQPMPQQPVNPDLAQPAYAETAPAPAQQQQPQFVAPEDLAPVGPPQYLAPVRVAQDPRQRTMAAVITFAALLVALWAILGFMGSLSDTLASVQGGNAKLKGQLTDANAGLVLLDEKTGHLAQMSADSRRMNELLSSVDSDMGGMLAGVDRIAAGMEAMNGSLGTLDGELGKVNEINAGMSSKLDAIGAGLKAQVRTVGGMRRDVVATDKVLTSIPGRLEATNQRLAYVNNSVNIMGCRGIKNNLEVDIFIGPLRNGSAKVYATVVPPGAWGFREDGVTPC